MTEYCRQTSTVVVAWSFTGAFLFSFLMKKSNGEGRIRLSTVTPHLPKILSTPDSPYPLSHVGHVTTREEGLPDVCWNRSSKKRFPFEFSLARTNFAFHWSLVSAALENRERIGHFPSNPAVSAAPAPIMDWSVLAHSDLHLLDGPLRSMQLGIA